MAAKNTGVSKAIETYVPAIFVGMGGSGVRVLSALRQKAKVKFEQELGFDGAREILDRVFQFIAIDTVSGTGPDALEIPANNYFRLGGFDGRETCRVRMQQDSYFKRWWYEEYPSVELHTGADVRINGRLCLLQNMATSPNVAEALRNACNRAAEITQENIEESEGDFPINVFLFSSIAGGTGAGIFIDMAYFIQDQLGKAFAPTIFGYLITPEIIEMVAPAMDRVKFRAHAYAALRELNFWQNSVNRGVGYEWRIGSKTVKFPQSRRPFTLVHLICQQNENGKHIGSFARAHRLIADVCFCSAMMPKTAYKQNETIFNLKSQYDTNPVFNKDFPVTFGSAAVAMLRFPRRKMATYIAIDLLPAVLRDVVMKESAEAGRNEAGDFMKGKGGLEVERLQRVLLDDPRCPGEPVAYQKRIEKIARSELDGFAKGVEEEIRRYRGNLITYLDGGGEMGRGKVSELVEQSQAAVDAWVNDILDRTEGNRIGILAQAMEICVQRLEGQLKGGEQPGLLRHLLDEAVKKEKTAEEEYRATLEELRNAGLFNKGERRRALKEALENYLAAAKTQMVLLRVEAIVNAALLYLRKAKACLKFVRKDVVHQVFALFEGQKSQVWESAEYDDERGGIVIEVMGKDWAEAKLSDLKNRKEFEDKTLSPLRAETAVLCIREIRKTWTEVKEGRSIDNIVVERRLAAIEEYKRDILEKAIALLHEDLADLSLWTALESEAHYAGAQKPEEVRRYVLDRLARLRLKAACWWPVKEADLKDFGLFEAGMVRHLGIVVAHPDTAAYCKKAYGASLLAALGLEGKAGHLPGDDTDAIQLVVFKYGAPLFTFTPIRAYREAYDLRKRTLPNVPLYVDRRYERDDQYSLAFPEETPSPPGNLWKVVFAFAETIKFGEEENPRIQCDANRYTFDLPPICGVAPVSIRGRAEAQKALFRDNFSDGQSRCTPILRDFLDYWQTQLSGEQRRQRLTEECERIGGWIKRMGKPEQGTEKHRTLVTLREDMDTLRAVLERGGDFEFDEHDFGGE